MLWTWGTGDEDNLMYSQSSIETVNRKHIGIEELTQMIMAADESHDQLCTDASSMAQYKSKNLRSKHRVQFSV